VTGSNVGDPGGKSERNVVSNLFVKSCLDAGVSLDNSYYCRVKNCDIMRIGGKLPDDAPGGIISVNGGSNVFENNHISKITSGTFPITFGIYSVGRGDRILRNHISSSVVGIAFEQRNASRVSQNTFVSVGIKIRDLSPPDGDAMRQLDRPTSQGRTGKNQIGQ
jgi:Right handed beta helix region